MNCALDLAVALRASTERLRVILGIDLGDIACLVLLTPRSTDNVGTLQTHLLSWGHAEVFLWGILHEVLSLDIQLS